MASCGILSSSSVLRLRRIVFDAPFFFALDFAQSLAQILPVDSHLAQSLLPFLSAVAAALWWS
ncbi:hypothetical protein SAMN04515617_101249 [Collimonas sp. OK242]|nr:hypothetical protein SAMN04515617_101249 [Collimonas sp. OK242]